MFCQKCGNQVDDNLKFCPKCGNVLSGVTSAVQTGSVSAQRYGLSPRQEMRTSEINEMNKMINYFSQKSAEYEEYDRIGNDMARLARGYTTVKLVWGIILSAIGLVWVVYSAIVLIASHSRTEAIAGWISMAMGFITLGFGALLIFFHARGRSKFVRNRDYAYMRFDQLSDELNEYYNAYGYCSIGAEYTNPSNLIVILDTIRSGRADNARDAINILVEDAHRNNMEAIAHQTAVNTAAAARGARAGAIFSAANFFLK